MKHKYSIIGILFAVLGIILNLTAIQMWTVDNDIYPVFAPYLAKFLSFFSSTQNVESGYAPSGFLLTEDFVREFFKWLSIVFGSIAVVLSLISISKQESNIYMISSLLLGNSNFILVNHIAAILILFISGILAIYLKYNVFNGVENE